MKPPSRWKPFLLVTTVVGLCSSAQAQISFTLADLPSASGDYYRAYATTGSVSFGSVGASGGPRRWDVSAPRYSDEIIKRMDIVPVADGGHGGVFSEAAYAQRLTSEGDSSQNWEYYQVTTSQGRLFYGAYDAIASPDCPERVFAPPTPDLPAVIQFGQKWSRSTEWEDCYDIGFAVAPAHVRFEAQAEVDAYGILVLAGLGERPALRVNELHTYVTTVYLPLFPPIDLTNCFREYYWLAPGIGKALDIVSAAQPTPPPADFELASVFLRVFEARRPRDQPPQPVVDLLARVSKGQLSLNWRTATNGTGYRVETLSSLSSSEWQSLAEPTSNAWSDAWSQGVTQRFYRVFVKP